MKTIVIREAGGPDVLTLADVPRPEPDAGEVLIKVVAAGVNRPDVLQRMGLYPPPKGASNIPGLEVAGEIAAVGEGVSRWTIGDKVAALTAGGGYAEYALASEKCLLPIPNGVSVADAAALPEVHFTVWTNLMDTARLRPGESVLIHGGTSGIGTAAIQLCVARGHKVFSTAASDEKCVAIRALGGDAINYKEQDFVAVVKDATGGRGVDVILDMVGGEYIQRNMSAAALWGRIVNIAYQAGMQANVNFAPMLMKRLSLLATTLRARSNDEKGAIRDALAREVWPLINAGTIKPVVDRTYPLADAAEAHRRMAGSGHIGKILLKT